MAANKIITMLQTQQKSQFFPKLFNVADCDCKISHLYEIICIVYQVQSANLIIVKNICEICWFILLIDKIVTIILNDGSCMKKNAHPCCCYKLFFPFFLEKSVAVTSFMVCIVQTLKVSISNEPPCCACVFLRERRSV